MQLESLGWNAGFAVAFTPHLDRGLEAARVAREDRGRYLILAASGELTAEVTGRFRHDARDRVDFPATGDWVAIQSDQDRASIHAVLPRTSAFIRPASGETSEEQVLAANVDTAFLVAGLDHDFNPRRLERYVASAWESGAQPVLVLNKVDLVADLDQWIAQAEAVAPGVPVIALSAQTGAGLERLASWIGTGKTVVLLGSSGVGKSTLVNALLGEDRQATSEVRAHDSRGRHTTTARELLVLPGGGVLIDTPGIRALKLAAGEESMAGAFADIEALARSCRFRDCRHDGEPGCAVAAAISGGGLDPTRFESWRKLEREAKWLAARKDRRLQAQIESKWRAISKSMKHHPKAKRWR
jgi:ribosome biogenesis GTPase